MRSGSRCRGMSCRSAGRTRSPTSTARCRRACSTWRSGSGAGRSCCSRRARSRCWPGSQRTAEETFVFDVDDGLRRRARRPAQPVQDPGQGRRRAAAVAGHRRARACPASTTSSPPIRGRRRASREGTLDELERLRIEDGWPAMGAEIVPGETIPAETGVVPVAVDFKKGCYPGQELVERMDSRGASAPRRLRVLDRRRGLEARRPDRARRRRGRRADQRRRHPGARARASRDGVELGRGAAAEPIAGTCDQPVGCSEAAEGDDVGAGADGGQLGGLVDDGGQPVVDVGGVGGGPQPGDGGVLRRRGRRRPGRSWRPAAAAAGGRRTRRRTWPPRGTRRR